MSTQFESELESGYPGYEGHITSCVISEQPGQLTQWDKVLDATNPWYINLWWHVQGPNVPITTGTWHVQAFLESIGPGAEVAAPTPAVAVLCTPGTNQYTAALTIPANTVSVTAGTTTPFKVVVTLTFLDGTGNPGKIAGFVEVPVMQFYA